MIKYALYTATMVAHWVIAMTFMAITGKVGMILVVAHWFVFSACCLSHMERFIHIKFVGESWLPETWRGSYAYRLFSKIHPIFK